MAMFGNNNWRIGQSGLDDNALTPQTFAPQDTTPSWLPQIPNAAPEPTGFNKPGGWAERLGAIGGILQNYGGRPNDAYDNFIQRNDQRRKEVLAQRQQALKAFLPQEVGGTITRLNSQTGKYDMLYAPPAKPEGPHFWETNDGSLAAIGGNYGADPKVLYKDPTPKIDWIAADDGQGGKVLKPYVRGGAAPSGPALGTVEGGYRFKGGDPANQGNWEPVGGPTPAASGTFR
jgi:hypothetical protein